jgi:dTDP-4-dehydrorhamnose 3,5-epimerase
LEIQKFEIEGPLLIHLKAFHDDRGFFVERFNEAKFKELHLPTNFIQDNFSHSKKDVVRGLHFQYNPPQGKLVSCTRGEIYDVVVDIRKGSKTYGQHLSVTLAGATPTLFWIPAGFAHGFCATSEGGADVLYKVNNPWSATGEGSILWNDADLAIPWPTKNPLLSNKDKVGQSFKNYQPQ